MGTKVHRESLFSGYQSMRDLNEDSSGCSWPLYYGDNKALGNGQCYNGFPPKTMADAYLGYEKDVVRRTMLEHEAVFKSQVYELHRLYRIQRDIMGELKTKEISRKRIPVEASFSSSPLLSQVTYDDARKWQMPNFPLANSVIDRPSMSVVEDNGHSPISSRRGSNSVVGPIPSQNGANSKDIELLEVRPVKMRKKMIDLHLPADEYIDTEETVEFRDNRVNNTSSHLPNGVVKAEFHGDSLRISSDFRSSNGLADLNEPIKGQEANGFTYGYTRDSCNRDLCDRRKIPSVSSTKEVSLNSDRGREHLAAISLHSDNNGSQKVWPPQALEAGHYTGIQKSAPFLQPVKTWNSSQPTQFLFNNSREVSGFPRSGWRERTFIDLEADTSGREVIHQSHFESSVASNVHSLQPCNPPGSVVPWNHLHSSSRGNPSFGFLQKAASAQVHPFQNFSDALSGNSQKQGFLMDRLQSDSNSRFNQRCGNNSWSNQNGFYHGSSSASKEIQVNFPEIGYNYVNGRSDHGPAKMCQNSDGSEMKPVIDVNLNVAVLNGEKEGHSAVLPWLNSKSACKSEITDGQQDPMASGILKSLATKDDQRTKVQNHVCSDNMKSNNSSNNFGTKKIEAGDCSTNGTILGRPVFDEPCSYGDQLSAGSGKTRNVRMLDINVPCEPTAFLLDEDQSTQDLTGTKISTGFKREIDLNMSLSEDEDCSAPLGSRLNAKVPMIDLEAPAVPESDEDDIYEENSLDKLPKESREPLEELEKIAADAIVAISSAFQLSDPDHEVAAACPSSAEASENILQWFVETIHSHGDNHFEKLDTFLRSKGTENNGASSSMEEVDYFESMTLQLPEVTEDEYMPKPLVPEDLKFEEPSGPTLVMSQRPRRGNARRGRQRRDFQRDILPGLTSLSRHEATEDIQVFDGLMRAMGITWSSSLTRKKTGSTRGRRRLIAVNTPISPPTSISMDCPSPSIQHLNNNSNNGEAGLDDRSLTGWGKMTRRPRRQRCPAGNNRSHTAFA